MRLAGLKECGLCCEIMKEDGTMMHTPAHGTGRRVGSCNHHHKKQYRTTVNNMSVW